MVNSNPKPSPPPTTPVDKLFFFRAAHLEDVLHIYERENAGAHRAFGGRPIESLTSPQKKWVNIIGTPRRKSIEVARTASSSPRCFEPA